MKRLHTALLLAAITVATAFTACDTDADYI